MRHSNIPKFYIRWSPLKPTPINATESNLGEPLL